MRPPAPTSSSADSTPAFITDRSKPAEVAFSRPTMHTADASAAAWSRAASSAVIAAYDSTLTLPSSKRRTATPSSMVVVTGGASAMAPHPNGRPSPAPKAPSRAHLPRRRRNYRALPRNRSTPDGFNGAVRHEHHLKTEFARKVLGQLEAETSATGGCW